MVIILIKEQLLYIALTICPSLAKSLQLILEISTTHRLVSYLVADNWQICRLSLDFFAWLPTTAKSVVLCNAVFVVVFFQKNVW